jgi:hypothetical protein
MVDEQSVRRPGFVEGTRIRLANGQEWTFPDHPPSKEDVEHQAVLREIGEAEDAADLLRAELALAIHLLSRNYDLTPEGFQAILDFAPGDPVLAEMQRAVHELATAQYRAFRHLPNSNAGSTLAPMVHWRILKLLKPRSRIGSMRSFWLN